MVDASRVAVLDFETTGFKQNAPVSLALAYYENGKRTYAKYFIINPEAPIEDGAFKVHGISAQEAKKHKTFPYVWEEIKPYIEGSLCVAHNSKYDITKVLVPTLKRYHIPVPTIEMLCTRDNAKAILPKQKSYTLDAVCDTLGIVCENHHNASYDTMMCQRIFARLYNTHPELMFSVVVTGDYNPKNYSPEFKAEDVDNDFIF